MSSRRPGARFNRRGIGLARAAVGGVLAVWHADDITPQADNTELAIWAPRVGSVPLVKDGVAASGVYRTDFETGDGLPCVEFVGANSSRMVADAIASAFSGTNTPFFVYVFAMATTAADDQTLFSFGNSASSNAFVRMRVDTDGVDADRAIIFRADNSGASHNQSSLSPGVLDVTGPLGFAGRFTGTDLGYVLGKRHIRSTASSLGEVTLNRFTVACFRRSGASATNFYSGKIRAIVVARAALTDAQVAVYDDWARGFAGRVRDIVCSGDSLTVGMGGTVALGGYRKALWTLIQQNRYAADMAGVDSLEKGNWPRRQASATIAWSVQQIRADLNATLATLTNVGLVILIAGSNNVNNQGDAAVEYAAMLVDIVTAFPSVRIAVSPIPCKGNTHEDEAQEWNRRLQGTGEFAGVGLWETFEAAYPGVLVYGFNVRTVHPTFDQDKYADFIHPNDVGYGEWSNHPTAGVLQAVEPIIATW